MEFILPKVLVILIVIAAVRAALDALRKSQSQPPPERHPAGQPGRHATVPPRRPAGSLEEVYRQLRDQILADQQRTATPPPMPATQPQRSPARPQLRVAPPLAVQAPAVASRHHASKHRREHHAQPARHWFKDSADLRRAIVTREILDPPLALRTPRA